MKPVYRFVIFIYLISVVSCQNKDHEYPVPKPGAGADSFVIMTGSFKIGPEKYLADFGTVTVPENRNRKGSRLIHIPFLRIHSQSENPGEPVFGLAGGPGASNLKWDWWKAWTFLANHDFVVVGYRGVDGSTVLDCPEVNKAFRVNDDVLGEEALNNIGNAWHAAFVRFRSQGIDLDGYTMPECIEDHESVRRALSYTRINLLSESYGTRVAYLYGLMYPEHVNRSAMISVNPPGHFVWDAGTIDAQLRHYALLWQKDPVMHGKSPDLYQLFHRTLNAMPEKWFLLPINPAKVRVVTFALLFQRKTAAKVFDAFLSAGKGDPAGLALMSLAYDFVIPSLSTWGDLALKALSADYDSSRNYCEETDTSVLPLGSPLTKALWCPLVHASWPVRKIPKEFQNLQHSDTETLLLSGSIDFSTPAEFASNELLPYLRNGRQVILSECGHVSDMWYARVDNTRRMLTSFYNTGSPDTSLNQYVPMDFNVKWGFARIAKAATGIISLVILMLVTAMVLFLIRRHKKHFSDMNAILLKE